MADEKFMSVSDALSLAKGALETIPRICITGEVSGFRGQNARSGHCYFQLKDTLASMDVIIWRGIYEAHDLKLSDGMQIEAKGSFNLYQASGKMSFVISSFQLVGEGALRQQVALLAKKLQQEGLMDDARKLMPPRFCTRIVVCTSLSGSVIEDVKRTLRRRNPLVEIQVVGCAVQGAHAPRTICRALRIAAAAAPDAILLVRGGGSFEDLMCFNDEEVARTIASCRVPVITGIGHEPDTSIADLVSDRRTSTPTAAAESVAPAIDELQQLTHQRKNRLITCGQALIHTLSSELSQHDDALRRTMAGYLSQKETYVASLARHSCLRSPRGFLIDRAYQLEMTRERFSAATRRLLSYPTSHVAQMSLRMKDVSQRMFVPYTHRLDVFTQALSALDPLSALKRGYSLVKDERGHVISNASSQEVGDSISIELREGTLEATVTKIHPKPRTLPT